MSKDFTPEEREQVQRLQADANHFRGLLHIKRQELQRLKAVPISSRDPVAMLKVRDRITEYLRATQDREQAARVITQRVAAR